MTQNLGSRTALLLCNIVFCFAADARQTNAQGDSPSEGALSETRWYDSNSDSIRPVIVQEFTDDSVNRGSRWLPKPKKLKKKSDTASSTATQAGTSNGVFGTDLTVANIIGWLILALVICVLIGGLVYAFSRAEVDLDGKSNKTKQSDLDNAAPDEQTLQRIKHLPAELRRTDVNLRSEARRLMEVGNYDQAIILLLGHQLILLDRATILRLNRGKTNGRYVREANVTAPSVADILKQTTTSFERSYFGRHSLDATTFQQLWQANESLENLVATREEVAA